MELKLTYKKPRYVYYILSPKGQYFGPLTRKPGVSKIHRVIKYNLTEDDNTK
jgi:hypothetical protein